VAAFADVVLRGLALSGQAIAIGGVLFALLILRPPRRTSAVPPSASPSSRVWLLVALAAAGLALAQSLALGVLVAALGAPSTWTVRELASTAFVEASLVKILASLALAGAALVVRRRPRVGMWWAVLLGSAAALVVSATFMSHGVARLDHRAALMTLDALHQLAACAWIGGLVHLMVVAFAAHEEPLPAGLLQRFSTVACAAVAVLITAGVGLSLGYIDGLQALLGTAYGVMVLTKATILGGLLLLGAANFLVIRRLPDASAPSPPRLRCFVEVELGLGITVLFAAASLTSLPPAIDVVSDRATLGEVAAQFTPQWPRLTSPSIDQLPVDDPDAPRTDADRAWSEYNHHVSGLFVLVMGALAILHVSGRAPWARHWPLVLLGLAAFMLVRNDPGAWPLGPQGFWASMAEPTVLQHRVFVLLVVVFGIFEWRVRTGRISSPRSALVFPLLCAVGGGLLLTHSHASLNLKAEFLLEVSHAPLGVLGISIGWARWLELRLAAPDDRMPGRIWASALAVFGVLLLLYRES
jgi:putative copper resistance protein D